MEYFTPRNQTISLTNMSIPAKLAMQRVLDKRNRYVERVMTRASEIKNMQTEQEQLFRLLPTAILPEWVKVRYSGVLKKRQLTAWELDVIKEYLFIELETPRAHLIEGLETMLTMNPHFNQTDILEDLHRYLLKSC